MLLLSPARALLPAAALLTLAAAAPSAQAKAVDISFKAVAGDQPVACGTTIAGLGTAAQSAQLADLRFYVTDVALLRRDGAAVPVKLRASAFQLARRAASVTLIDLENGRGGCAQEGTAATNAHVRGTVPAGIYTGLRYTVGVPEALNHTDLAAAPAPLNLTAMGWSWQVGRKFLKIETADPTFMVHLGSTGCTGNPATGRAVRCTNANRVAVKFKSFDPARQAVAVDVRSLLNGSDLGSAAMGSMGASTAQMDMGDMAGCMSGPGEAGCGPVFGRLGLAWSDTAGGGAASAARQKVFRAIAR